MAGVLAFTAFVPAGQERPTQEQRPPVFRAGATFVNVDVYPRRDGRVIEGLTKADFEVLEDGKPQAVESFEFVRIAPNTPDAERRDPTSAADALRQAADPHNRLFVIYLDPYHTTVAGSHATRRPVVEFLTRAIGPTDLFAFMTPDIPVGQMTFGRRVETIASELEKYWTWGEGGYNRAIFIRDELERRLSMCDPDNKLGLILKHREDKISTGLSELVTRLGSLRDERKNLLLITEGWVPAPARQPGAAGLGSDLPGIGVGPGGRLGLGNDMSGNRDVSWCNSQMSRLAGTDFEQRFRDLLVQAARANVAVFPIDVGGLKTGTPTADGNMNADFRLKQDTLRTLAENTDGSVVMDTNDLTGAARKIADDLSAFYLLGYYSSNTAADGRFRRIEVKVKQNGVRTSARRGYLAPTADMRRAADAAAGAPARAEAPVGLTNALGALGRLRDEATLFGAGSVVGGGLEVVVEIASRQSGAAQWAKGGAVAVQVSDASGRKTDAAGAIDAGTRSTVVRVPLDPGAKGPWTVFARVSAAGESLEQSFEVGPEPAGLVGEGQVFRATPSPRSPVRPVADRQFRRTERLHVEWPLRESAPDRAGRLLNARGEALALPIVVTERADQAGLRLVVDLVLTPLSEGDYVVEIAAGPSDRRDIQYAAFRVVR